MKRFLMLLAVAAVAGVTYVAAAPGSALHAGPTWRQFNALKKQVASLQKTLKQVKTTSTNDDGFLKNCFANAAPVGVFGDTTDFGNNATQTFGYEYDATAGTDTGTPTYSTALNLDNSATPQAYFQIVDSSCISPAAAAQASGHFTLRAERTP